MKYSTLPHQGRKNIFVQNRLVCGCTFASEIKQLRSPQAFLLLLGCTCYIPVLLVWSGGIPFSYRFYVLAAVLLSFLLLTVARGYGFRELGITLTGSLPSLRWNILFCAGGAIGLLLLHGQGIAMPRGYDYSLACFLFYIFFLSPVQELIFRGVLFAEMRRCRITHPFWMLLISASTFCFLHIIYNHPPLLVITFFSGVVWGFMYLRWPSIWGLALSHSVLGSLAMLLGVL